METWTFLTNYGHVLLCIAVNLDTRLKEVAERAGIKERSTQSRPESVYAEEWACGCLRR